MLTDQYRTRNHVLPLVRVRGRVAVVVRETSEWFRRSLAPHLEENARVPVEAADGYAYCLQARGVARPPVLARRLGFRWRVGLLLLESATGVDGRPVDLNALFTAPAVPKAADPEREDRQAMHETPRELEAVAATILAGKAEDSSLSKSGLHPVVQSQLAETARQESALRLALLGRVHEGDAGASALCVKLLGTSFGGFDPKMDLYRQAAAKFATASYAPHLRDLLANLIVSPRPTSLQACARDFCHHLQEADIEAAWAAEVHARK